MVPKPFVVAQIITAITTLMNEADSHEVVVATPVIPERTGGAKSAENTSGKTKNKSRTKPRESNDR